MAKFQDTVETLITARNEAMGQLRAAEQQMQEQAQRERARQQQEMQAAKVREQSAIQHLQQLSKIAVAAGAARAGISALNIAAQLLSGDMEKASAAADRLPFGIGGAVREARELIQLMRGTADEAERQERITAQITRAAEARREAQTAELAFAGRQRADERKRHDTLVALNRERTLAEAAPGDRDLAGMRIDHERELAAIGREIEDIEAARAQREIEQQKAIDAGRERMQEIREQRRGGSAAGLTAIGREHERLLAQELNDLATIESTREAQHEQDRRRIEDLRGIMGRTREAQREREQQHQREQRERQAQADRDVAEQRRRAVEDADAQIEQARLRMLGRTVDAELHANEHITEQRVRIAEEANHHELADRLRTLGDMRAAEIEAAEQRRREQEAERARAERDVAAERRASEAIAPLPQAGQDRFLTGAREMTLAQDRAEAGAANNNPELDESKKQTRLLERLVDADQRDATRIRVVEDL